MPLSTRELTLILRARDETSRVLRGVGASMGRLSSEAAAAARASYMHSQALATSGIAVASAGALALVALNNMTNAAMEYNQQASVTLTQVDGLALSLEDVKNMGRDLASVMPVAFEQVQGALYDIFSSIETDGPGAKLILEGIGKAAVGGAVDMETAGRITLAILNAWKMEAKDVGHVNDVMFQLVRKGVGTYDEFGKSLGRAIPSALKAGQSVESLAGMMAFLTRNGLSTSMAATSAARAFDAMSNPKTIQRFKEIGIAVTDAKGNFRPMVDIVSEMREKFEKLTPAAKAARLQELFKGSGGTIQAMRFFNLALNDSHGLLNTLTTDMHNAGGAANDAYKIMANTPQAQLQLFSNRFQVLKTVIGDQLIPIKLKLVAILGRIMDWFNKLNPATQSWIVKAALIGATLAVVIGVLMSVVGVFGMFSAALTLAGTSIGALMVPILGVIAVIGLLVAAGVLIYKNWDTVKAKAAAVWSYVSGIVQTLVVAFQTFVGHIVAFGQQVWQVIGPGLMQAWTAISTGVQNMITTIMPYWNQFTAALQVFGALAVQIGTGIGEWLGRAFDLLKPIIYAVAGAFMTLAQIVGNVLGAVFSTIGGVVGNVIQIFTGLIDFIRAVFTGQWGEAWNAVLSILKGFVGIVVSLLKGLWQAIVGIVTGIVNGVIGFFQRLFNTLVGNSIIPDMIMAIIKWFASLPGKVLAAIASLVASLAAKGAEFMNSLWNGLKTVWTSVIGWVARIPSLILTGLGNLGSLLFNAGKQILQGLLDGLKNMWGNVTSFIGGIGSWIQEHKGPKQYDLKLLQPAGRWILQGLQMGLRQEMPGLRRALSMVSNEVASTQLTGLITGRVSSATSTTGAEGTVGTSRPPIEMNVYTQEINPVKHAADLGFEVSRRLGF